MRRFVPLAAACLVMLAADKPKSDKDEFQGTWVLDEGGRSKKNGVPLPEELRKNLKITFAGDKVIFKNGDDTHHGTFTLEPDKKPKAITITHGDGRTKDSKGIYYFARGLLVLCFTEPGGERPKEIPKGDWKGEYLVLQRAKS
jgi:uncharacterized protein (TIGR03067 family)